METIIIKSMEEKIREFIKQYCIVEHGSVLTKERNAWISVSMIPFFIENEIYDFYAYRDMRKTQKSRVACCGFSKTQQKWYGWSHRGVRCFGIGDSYLGGKKAKTLEDCKKLAYEAVRALD